MNRSRTQMAVFGALAFLGMSGVASGQCIDSLDGTNATSVLDASGQGNFSCADMSPGPDGGSMKDISHLVILSPANGSPSKISITVPEAQLPRKELDAVYIKAKGNGARCLYTFSDYTDSAIGLESGGDKFSPADVVVCADDLPLVPPIEPTIVEPISTIGDGCQGDITIDGLALPEDQTVAVVSAVSLDGQTLAVCSGDDTTTQVQCVNTCVNFEPRAETSACAEASAGLMNGELDLEACRPCDLTDTTGATPPPAVDKDDNPLFYCWEYTNSVVRDPPLNENYPTPGTVFVPGTEEDEFPILRTWATMLPHKEAWSAAEATETFNGCYKKTVYLNGRAYTYTTCY